MSQLFCVSKSTVTILLTNLIFCEANYSRTLDGKIVGGQYTDISKFPHAVFLSIKCGTVHMICGATVVNQQILLTAAHCLSDCHEKLVITAYAGHENLEQVTVVRKVSKTAIHRNFVDETLQNDIALVLLSQKLPLGNRIKRIIIKPRHGEKLTAIVAGWGVINDVTRERTMTLKMVQQPLQPPNICALAGYLHVGMMCAGDSKSTNHRPSRGDSGSGLVTSDYQLIGLVSFRNEHYPGLVVYTDISYFYNWLKQTSKKLYCSQR